MSYLDSQCCYFVCLFVCFGKRYIASLKWVVTMDDLLLVLTFIHLNVFFYRSETDVAVICCNLQYFGQFVNKLMFFILLHLIFVDFHNIFLLLVSGIFGAFCPWMACF